MLTKIIQMVRNHQKYLQEIKKFQRLNKTTNKNSNLNSHINLNNLTN